MPILKNPRWERFAQELASGKSASEAYALAGYKPDRSAAHRLSTKIRGRVQELLGQAGAETKITLQSLTAMYLQDRALALELKQVGVAKGCVDSLAKLYGLSVNRHEVGAPNDFARMSDEELEAIVLEGARQIAEKNAGKLN